MKPRWIAVPVTATLLLALGGGFAIGAARSELPPGMQTMGQMDQMAGACDAMHRSAAMQEMLTQMPAGLRDQCESMHGQMLQMMQMTGQTEGMMGDP